MNGDVIVTVKPRRVGMTLAMQEAARQRRQLRLLAALHGATRSLRGYMECFDDSHAVPSTGAFHRPEDQQEHDEGWAEVEECAAALAEFGIDINLTFEGQEVRLDGGE